MLKELRQISQKEESKFRRWFEDEYFQLIVWYDMSTGEGMSSFGNPYGFQLCYDIENKEKSLTWTEKDGFSHDNVDNSRNGMLIPSSPIMTADGPLDKSIEDRFKESATEIDENVTNFVLTKIHEFLKQ